MALNWPLWAHGGIRVTAEEEQHLAKTFGMAPLATAAYLLPLLWMPGDTGAGLASAATTLPVCVLVGEGIAWGMARLDQTERALPQERLATGPLPEAIRALFQAMILHKRPSNEPFGLPRPELAGYSRERSDGGRSSTRLILASFGLRAFPSPA